jgi:hypothetical protein
MNIFCKIYFAKMGELGSVLHLWNSCYMSTELQNCEVYKADEIFQQLKFWEKKLDLLGLFLVGGKNLLVMARLIHHPNHDSGYFEAMKKSSAILNSVEHNTRNA